MALSLVSKTLKDGNGTTFTGQFATDGTNLWPVAVLVNESGTIITDSTGLPVSLSSLPPLAAGSSTIGAVNQAGTWTVQPGNTANTTAWKVDGSGVTQPVSGTVTANAGTNLNTSALALEGGGNLAAVASGVLSQGATTSGQKGSLEMGAVTTAAPSYTTGQTSPLSLNTSGGLRVDGSGVTQPVSGTVTANAGSGTFGTNVSQVGGSAVSTAASGVQKVGITGNAGAAVDATGQNAASPANEVIVGGQFNTTPTTITSGNVSPLQLDSSGNLKVNVAAGGTAGGTSSSFGAAFPGIGTAAGLEYLSSAPTLTSGNMAALQGDVNGNLKINLQTALPAGSNAIGTVTANAGTNLNTSALALEGGGNLAAVASGVLSQGATTSGQKGSLEMGAVTTAAPSYTTGQTSPLSLNTSGGLRVDGSGVTQPVSGTVTANAGSGTFGTNVSQVGGSAVSTAASGVQKVGITGNAGAAFDCASTQNIPTPANMIMVGAEFNTSPATITSGNSSPLQLDSSGNLKVNVAAGGAAGGTSSSFGAAFPAIGTAAGLEYLSSAPTLTSGNMAALQGDVNGNLKINLQTALPAGANLIGSANLQAASSGGTSTYAAIGITSPGTGPILTNSVTSIKASAGTLYRVRGYNPNTTLVWIQLFDLASGSVTLGTTAPKDPIPLLPNSGFDELLSGDFGAAYLIAVSAAATTTSTGNTAPATGVTATFYFK